MRPDLVASDGYLYNFWYVAGRSEDFSGTLKPLKILEEEIVFFRGPDGEPIALEDACPHRKLPLSQGTIEGSTIVCGYHGLTWDKTGECVIAPTQLDNPPKRAAVRSYPVSDRWGFLWVWMGDSELADENEIFDIPNFNDSGWAKTEKGAMSMASHYLYITDNLLDPSHVAWVHVTSFAGAGTDHRPLDTEDYDQGVIVSRWIKDEAPPPYYADILPFGPNCDRKQHYECRLPSICINKSIFVPVGEGGSDKPLTRNAFINISYNFITPIDGENSMYFWFQHRNMFPDDTALSERMFEGALTAFNEDKSVLEHVQAGMSKRKTGYINKKEA